MQNHRDPEGSAPRGSFSARTLAPTLAALLALSACGAGSSPPKVARSPCLRAIAAAVGAHATVTLDARAPDLTTCTYRAGTPRARVVTVTLDTAPQASRRFSRTVVEQAQAHLGDDRGELPVEVAGIGEGAAWTAAARQLMATDGRRLVTVAVAAPSAPPRAALATAATVARAALGG